MELKKLIKEIRSSKSAHLAKLNELIHKLVYYLHHYLQFSLLHNSRNFPNSNTHIAPTNTNKMPLT